MSGPVPTGRAPQLLTSIEELVEYFRDGGKPRAAWRVGVEQEKIVVDSQGRAVPFVGTRGIEALLRALAGREFSPLTEDGHLLALARQGQKITVEPGGQFELSGRPLNSARACADELAAHLREVKDAAAPLGLRFLGVGLHPFATLDELPWLPRQRYAIMRAYLPRRGKLGHEMMKRTATVQVNFDYDDEATAVDKIRTALGVSSIVTALFAASPVTEGRPNGYRSFRAAVWLDTDEDRCGILPFAFADRFGFRDYVEWALDVPMFFVVRGGVHHEVSGMPFRKFLRDGWNGERATLADWEMHLSTVFPEVRLKRTIEVRGADAGPIPMATALPALWRGLLDDPEARAAAWALVRGASVAERLVLRREVPRAGLTARLLGRPLRELAVELCDIAAAGLRRLPAGTEDVSLLAPAHERAIAGRAPADDMLDDLAATKGNPVQLVDRWELK